MSEKPDMLPHSRAAQLHEVLSEFATSGEVDIYKLHEKYSHTAGFLAWTIKFLTSTGAFEESNGIISMKARNS